MLLKVQDYTNGEVHPGSKELLEHVTNFVNPPLLFNQDGWNKWGVMGLLADFVLTYAQGDMVEIGIGESSYYFTHLAKKFNRNVYHCDIQRSDYENLCTVDGFFSDDNLLYHGSSTDFFKEIELPSIALGFIDGDHLHEQVEEDFNNLLPYMVDNGFIFFHDLFPADEGETAENRSGDGYIFRKKLERRNDIDVFTFPFTAWNAGLTMVRKIPVNEIIYRRSGRDVK